MERIGSQESVRHERIDEVIESTSLRGIYEVVEERRDGCPRATAVRRARLT
jgi:hypothetical protein